MIRLAKSKYNWSGHLIKFMAESLTVFDNEPGAWCRANVGLTVSRHESVESMVCASSFLGISRKYFAVLTHPDTRVAKLEQLAARLAWSGVSVVRLFGSPRPRRLFGCAAYSVGFWPRTCWSS